jgi:hypothetical protein
MKCQVRLRFLSVCLALACGPRAFSQEVAAPATRLPPASGKYGIGRTTYHWVDASRPEQFSKTPGAHRELIVYVWYPASKQSSSTRRAPYLPDSDVIGQSKDAEEMRDFWGNSWPSVLAGKVMNEVLDTPRIAPGKERFPLITFSPGLGVPVTAYSTLIQDLVSHGYVVASIEPTYEATAVVFPDGRVVTALPEATGRHLPGPDNESREQFIRRMHKFDEPHLDRWAADMRFTIDQLTAMNAGTSTAPFAQRLDLQNIAAWGHSFGGRAAPHACQRDARIKACLNADGLGPDGPIFVYEGTALPAQPFMWMEVHHEAPTEAQLAPYGITRREWEKNHQVQIATNEQQLRACPGGSFHVTISTPGIDHMSFTDLPFISAKTKQQTDEASLALLTLSQYTTAFFDKELKHKKGTLLNKNSPQLAGVSSEQFGRVR